MPSFRRHVSDLGVHRIKDFELNNNSDSDTGNSDSEALSEDGLENSNVS